MQTTFLISSCFATWWGKCTSAVYNMSGLWFLRPFCCFYFCHSVVFVVEENVRVGVCVVAGYSWRGNRGWKKWRGKEASGRVRLLASNVVDSTSTSDIHTIHPCKRLEDIVSLVFQINTCIKFRFETKQTCVAVFFQAFNLLVFLDLWIQCRHVKFNKHHLK